MGKGKNGVQWLILIIAGIINTSLMALPFLVGNGMETSGLELLEYVDESGFLPKYIGILACLISATGGVLTPFAIIGGIINLFNSNSIRNKYGKFVRGIYSFHFFLHFMLYFALLLVCKGTIYEDLGSIVEIGSGLGAKIIILTIFSGFMNKLNYGKFGIRSGTLSGESFGTKFKIGAKWAFYIAFGWILISLLTSESFLNFVYDGEVQNGINAFSFVMVSAEGIWQILAQVAIYGIYACACMYVVVATVGFIKCLFNSLAHVKVLGGSYQKGIKLFGKLLLAFNVLLIVASITIADAPTEYYYYEVGSAPFIILGAFIGMMILRIIFRAPLRFYADNYSYSSSSNSSYSSSSTKTSSSYSSSYSYGKSSYSKKYGFGSKLKTFFGWVGKIIIFPFVLIFKIIAFPFVKIGQAISNKRTYSYSKTNKTKTSTPRPVRNPMKHTTKVAIWQIVATFVCFVALCLSLGWGAPELLYSFASSKFNQGEYRQAGEIYEVIYQYKDSKDRVNACHGMQNGKVGAYLSVMQQTEYDMPDTEKIVDGAFENCDVLQSVTLPVGLKTIGKRAFANCTSLTEIYIPASVTHIEAEAFSGCTSLTTVHFGENLVSIGDFAFENCPALEQITLNSNVKNVGMGAFANCENLVIASVYTGVENIGGFAFDNCPSVSIFYEGEQKPDGWSDKWNGFNNSVIWGYLGTLGTTQDGLKWVSTSEFSASVVGYTGGASLVIPSEIDGRTVNKISQNAFKNKKNLVSVHIPSTVVDIADLAFSDCDALCEIVLPNSVQTIGKYAFKNCKDLLKAVIPSSVVYIGEGVFSGSEDVIICCQSSAKPNGWDNKWNKDEYNVAWGQTDIPVDYDHLEISLGGSETTITKYTGTYSTVKIPSMIDGRTVKIIGSEAFADSSFIRNVELPSSLTTISQNAFKNCSKMKSITIPSSVRNIESSAFIGCSSLKEMSLSVFSTHVDYTVQNDSSYPFRLQNGNLISTNKSSNTTSRLTITATDNITLSFRYKASSESGYDKLKVFKNGTEVISSSGTNNSYVSYSENLADGDVITLSYSKDGSGSYGDDCAYFNNVLIDGEPFIFAESSTNNFAKIFSTESFNNSTKVVQDDTNYYVPTALKEVYVISGTIPSYYFENLSTLTKVVILEGVTLIQEDAFINCSSNLWIHCEAESKPISWEENWNSGANVVWNSTGNEPEVPSEPENPDEPEVPSEPEVPTEYVVTFMCDGFSYETKVITAGETTTRPTINPTKTGYTFSHWSTSVNGSAFNFNTTINSNLTLYAVFTQDTSEEPSQTYYSVVFIADGTTYYSKNVLDENTVTPPYSNPEKQGYTFLHWSLSEGGSAFDFATAITQNITLYAVFTETRYGQYSYDITNNGYTIVGYTGNESEIIIPSYSNTTPIIAIAPNAFDGCRATKIVVPETVVTIGTQAFANCVNLTELVLPDTVENIGSYILKGSNSIEKITCPATDFSYDYTVTNNSYSPFTYSDGILKSTNKTNSSSSSLIITATSALNVSLEYKASSESGWDYLRIKKNGSNVINSSGTSNQYQSYNVELNEGDTLTFIYEKDSSNSYGDDCAYFRNIIINGQEFTLTQTESISHFAKLFSNESGENLVRVQSNDADYYVPSTLCEVSIISGRIPDLFFSGMSMLERVIISEQVESVGESIFAGCTNLQYVELPTYDDEETESSQSLYSVEKATDYPFTQDGTTFKSSNYNVSSSASWFTIVAQSNITVTFNYQVSSESGYDFFRVYKNSSMTLYEISGSSSVYSGSATLSAGDTLKFLYSKDGSYNSGNDRATVSNIMVNGMPFNYEGSTSTRVHKVSNSTTYPFTLNSSNRLVPSNVGVSNSTSSFTLHVKASATVTFEYLVSSESSYDVFQVLKNGSQVVSSSGNNTSYQSMSISLSAGDLLVFSYSKDSSVNNYNDCAYIYNLKVNGIAVSLQDTDYNDVQQKTNAYGFAKLFGTNLMSSSYAVNVNGTNYYVPNSLTTVAVNGETLVGRYFEGFSKIENLLIRSSVTTIGANAFNGLTLPTIYCETQAEPNGWENGWNSGLYYVLGYAN